MWLVGKKRKIKLNSKDAHTRKGSAAEASQKKKEEEEENGALEKIKKKRNYISLYVSRLYLMIWSFR